MDISVIIPVKNRAHLLIETLKSVFNQTKLPDEVIVVDDHSNDNLEQHLKPFWHRIKLIKAEGEGPGAARNTGLKTANGTFIQFFDSDDLMTPTKLGEQFKTITSTDTDLVLSPFVKAVQDEACTWHQTDVIMNYKQLSGSLPLFDYVSRGWCPIVQSALFRRSLVDSTKGWREDVFTHEDLDFWFRVAECKPKIGHNPKAGVIYRQHGNQLTNLHTQRVNFATNHLKVLYTWENSVMHKANWLSRHVFTAKKYSSLKFLHENGILSDIPLPSDFSYMLTRFYNKKERLITRSQWETMHGISHSKKVFRNYVEEIHQHS